MKQNKILLFLLILSIFTNIYLIQRTLCTTTTTSTSTNINTPTTITSTTGTTRIRETTIKTNLIHNNNNKKNNKNNNNDDGNDNDQKIEQNSFQKEEETVLGSSISKLETYNVDQSKITLSGISSGGAMAVQFSVAFSASIYGAAIIAGIPFYCANANVEVALSSCMKYPDLIVLSELYYATWYAQSLHSIDSVSNLKHQRIWLFSGTKDDTVHHGVMVKTKEYYEHYGLSSSNNNLKFIDNISASHAWITPYSNHSCDFSGSPYMNNCADRDFPGELLQYLYHSITLSPKKNKAIPENLLQFSQTEFLPPGVTSEMASIDQIGYIYVPSSCKSQSVQCLLHVSFHGCLQNRANIGDTFVTHSGLNEWAESNHIIVLYPQTKSNLLNPKACFDWWGFTGLNYATKDGIQMKTVRNMLNRIIGGL